MALLMVVFIGGSALQGMLTPSNNRVVATSAVGDITFIDQQEVTHLTDLMAKMNLNWRQPLPVGYFDKPLEEIDWILLARETERLGLMLESANVRANFKEDDLNKMSRTLKVRVADLVEAARQFESVRGAAMKFAVAAEPSEADIRSLARDVLEMVHVNVVMLPAKMFVDDAATFTDEQIQTQFEHGKAKEKGEGLEFGYYRHPRVKAQFVSIDRDKLAGTIGVANLEAKAKKLYKEMAARSDKLIKRPAEELVDDGLGPAPSPVLSWDEAKDIVLQQVRLNQADQTADRIANWLIERAGSPWLSSDRGDNGYRTKPEGVTSGEYYGGLLGRLPHELNYPDALLVSESDFFTQEQALDVPEIGAAAYRASRGIPAPFTKLAFMNEGIVPEISTDTPDRANYMALFETCAYPLTNLATGKRYVFRIIATEAGRPAKDADEVRNEIVADLRLKAAFDVAKQKADSLRACVTDKSLKECFDADADLVALCTEKGGANSGYLEPPPFSRIRSYQAASGRSPRGVFVGGGLGIIPNDAVDACFAMGSAGTHAAVLPLALRADVMTAELVEVTEPEEAQFKETRTKLIDDVRSKRGTEVIQNWLTSEQIRTRNQLELVGRKG